MPKATDSVSLPAESAHKCEVCGKRATRKMTSNGNQAHPVWHQFCEEHGKIYWDAHCEGAVQQSC